MTALLVLVATLVTACAPPAPPRPAAPHVLTTAERERRDALFRQAWQPVQGDVLVGVFARPPAPPSWLTRQRLERSIGPMQEAIAIDPSWWQSWWGLGKIYERLGDAGEAQRCLGTALDFAPADVRGQIARDAGRAAQQTGDLDATIRFYESAATVDPEDPGIAANLALAHLRAGHLGTAEDVVRAGLDRSPGDPALRRVLARIEEAEGNGEPCPLPGGVCPPPNDPTAPAAEPGE
jgi:Flp pilus assembly protein TadD